jgi:hypothetical protein
MKKYKVRFNLGLGNNYRKWQIRDVNNNPKHYDPSKVTLVMSGCKLYNNTKTANKIFNGAHKTVCAWIECDNIDVVDKKALVGRRDNSISYNPRILPYWSDGNVNIDGYEYDIIYSDDIKLYALVRQTT